ncbi:MAG: potassium-transporting ATPase subunit KdpC [Elusimicrobiales bacterium]|jgi:K+-transporting ATPase ATPase C chain
MRTLITAVKLFVCMTVVTGIVYPLTVWVYAKAFFSDKAEGGVIIHGGKAVGAELIGQNFTKPGYFWPRPSAIAYNPMPSGGSNLSLTSRQLRDTMKKRGGKFGGVDVPADLVFASGSGLDPHLSPAAAFIQCDRVAKARGVAKVDIISLVDGMAEPRQDGFLGEPRVNVLLLNMKLDEKYPND